MMPSGLTKKQVKKSLKNSVLDAASYSSMAGLTQNYITPYALAMNATTTQVGFLTAIPYLAMILTQMIAPTLAERAGSRKRFILAGAFLHSLVWLPICLIPFIFQTNRIWWLILFVTLCVAFDSIGNAPWNSMMADLVPEQIRGHYFSYRTRISAMVSLLLSFVAGGILQLLTKNIFLAFSMIFAGASISRFFSTWFLSQMVEPPAVKPKTKQASIFELSLTLGSTNIGKFIIFNALLTFTTNLASPFFSVYMLSDLKFNYLTYFIATAIPTLITLLCIPFWGKIVDRNGNVKVLRVTMLFIPLLPILWLVSKSPYYLCGVQVLSGFAWAGCNLAVSLFLYVATQAENRTRYIALNNVLMFTGVSLGALLGGIIAPHVPLVLRNNLLTIFLISGVARILVVAIFLPKISEVRPVAEASVSEILFGGPQFSRVRGFSDVVFRRAKQNRKTKEK
ncbi:MAG: MFS transporter [Dehalococcoidales bacterium]|jgi:MFS family permease